MLSPVTHFLAVSPVRRLRLLPATGRVVVRKGQKVAATDVVAEVSLAPEHLLLDIARGLGLSPQKADEFLQLKAGDDVAEGDIVAGPVGMARRVVRATKPGRVVIAGGGQVLMEIASRPYELKAGIPGIVTELYDDRGVEIEATGSLIQGVWGNGRIDAGLMNVLARTPVDVLTTDRLDVSQRGSVIYGGCCNEADVLQTAAEIPVRGLILSSMDSALITLAEKMHYPIIIIEGFGTIPMNSAAFKILSTNERREVALNAEPWDRLVGIRPEIMIPLPAPGNLPLPIETDNFKPGQQIRVLQAEQKGMIGVLVNIRPGLTTLPSGLKAYAADIRLENGENAVFPLANLEVLV